MALVSPGVEVSVIDESQYIASAVATIPYILVATAQNKANAAGTGVAQGTLASNANKVYLITSQRDLVNTFGTPFFYKTSQNTPIHGYELNEYGLMAAYSVLGTTNRAYVQRVDVDLSELSARITRPSGTPDNGSVWFDLTETRWGIFVWNPYVGLGNFAPTTPIVITKASDLDAGVPKSTVGKFGDYAVVTTNANNPVYFKNFFGDWVLVGSNEWHQLQPAIRASEVNPVLTSGSSLVINGVTVTLTGTTVAALSTAINAAAIPGITSTVAFGVLVIGGSTEVGSSDSYLGGEISIVNGTGDLMGELGIGEGPYYIPEIQISSHTRVPRWRFTDTAPRPEGSIWVKTTPVNLGANFSIKRYESATDTWVAQSVSLYDTDQAANKALDPSGGGRNIPARSLYVQTDVNKNGELSYKIYKRLASGPTAVTSESLAPTATTGDRFTISVSSRNSETLSTPITCELSASTPEAFVQAVLSASLTNVECSIDEDNVITITHLDGGVIVLKNVIGTPLEDAGFGTDIENVRSGVDNDLILSNWVAETYTASLTEPSVRPADGAKWYYSTVDEIDIMIHDGNGWRGYRNVDIDVRGFDLTQTDPNGPQVSASEPSEQSDGTPLVLGDLWIDTSDLENYPLIKRYENIDGVEQWVLLDNTDQTTERGVLFGDARWANNDSTDPITDPIPSIRSLLTSDYLDLDAPDENLYPAGMLLWNTRRSGFNVKEFRVNYFNGIDYDIASLPDVRDTWVNATGNRTDGAPYMGRHAVRALVVQSLKEGMDTNTVIREEQRAFNLICCPGYPELIPNMVSLNNDRNNVSFVIGDTPLRLSDSGTDLLAWATNAAGGSTGEEGLAVSDPYLGVFYPAGLTSDLTGSQIVVPASHMMLRTIIRSDEVSYPWLAPAGTRRGIIDNAESIGYIDSITGEFVNVSNRVSIRDVLYENNINPMTFIPGTGLVNYGNKTTKPGSALDRINVARLVAYLRDRLEVLAKPFLFEPNDLITRNEMKNVVESLLNDLIAKRGIYDYLVVCDESNNTPDRIDRNELYVDIAIEPVKAVEFIYIPVRIKNTGEISAR